MQELRRCGCVRHVGLTGLGNPDSLREVMSSGQLETVQAPYNVLNPSAGQAMRIPLGEINYGNQFDICQQQRMGVFAIRVFAGGALVGNPPSDHTKKTPFFPLALYQRDQQTRRGTAASTTSRPIAEGNRVAICTATPRGLLRHRRVFISRPNRRRVAVHPSMIGDFVRAFSMPQAFPAEFPLFATNRNAKKPLFPMLAVAAEHQEESLHALGLATNGKATDRPAAFQRTNLKRATSKLTLRSHKEKLRNFVGKADPTDQIDPSGPPNRSLNSTSTFRGIYPEATANFLNHLFLVRKLSTLELRVDQLAIDSQLEAATFRGLQFHTGEFLFELREYLGRQTDGLWFVSSSSTVTKLNFHHTPTPFDCPLTVLFSGSSLRQTFSIGTLTRRAF